VVASGLRSGTLQAIFWAAAALLLVCISRSARQNGGLGRDAGGVVRRGYCRPWSVLSVLIGNLVAGRSGVPLNDALRPIQPRCGRGGGFGVLTRCRQAWCFFCSRRSRPENRPAL